MRNQQPRNLIKQFVIRADVDARLEQIAKQYRIAPQSMLERMIMEYDKEPEVIEVEPLPPIQHPMSEAIWQVLESGRRMNEQKAAYEQQQQKLKETK